MITANTSIHCEAVNENILVADQFTSGGGLDLIDSPSNGHAKALGVGSEKGLSCSDALEGNDLVVKNQVLGVGSGCHLQVLAEDALDFVDVGLAS